MRPRYVELQCEECKQEWEAYVRLDDDGDGGYDLVAMSDGPGCMSSTRCPECNEEGEQV